MYVYNTHGNFGIVLTGATGDWHTGSQGFQGTCTSRIRLSISCSRFVSSAYDLLICKNGAFIILNINVYAPYPYYARVLHLCCMW